MRHPLAAIPEDRRRGVFLAVLAATLIVMGGLSALDGPLRTSAAPQGMVSLELAGDGARAARILDSWGERGRRAAALSLGLDCLFLVLYATANALACLWAGRVLAPRALARLATPLAWGQWVAGALDAVENVALAVVLVDGPAGPWPALARAAAAPKFALVAMGLLYAAAGAAIALAARVRRGRGLARQDASSRLS
jgi:hypothetical protein